jgi:NADPH-dependent 7-cyano-7-deazaguanine reductase QueF-like protein
MNPTDTSPADSLLGRDIAYPREYAPELLYPIARAQGRAGLGIGEDALAFVGHDRWHAYELSWLDGSGKPQVATATIVIPAVSPSLIESKSLKLYLNSLNATRFADADSVRAVIAADLSRVAGAQTRVEFGLPAFVGEDGAAAFESVAPNAAADASVSIDALNIEIDDYGPPNAEHLACAADGIVEERMCSAEIQLPRDRPAGLGHAVPALSRAANRPCGLAALHRLVPRPRRVPRAMRRAHLRGCAAPVPPPGVVGGSPLHPARRLGHQPVAGHAGHGGASAAARTPAVMRSRAACASCWRTARQPPGKKPETDMDS